ncbi:hypothetical protein [Haladaptatus sp. NG-WS-4]
MADTKRGRNKQARDEETRQREREIEEARERADEPEPSLDEEEETDEIRDETGENPSRECHRRGCDQPAAFAVLERYQEETGHGAVEATALLCREHVVEEHPTNLDGVYDDYVFRVEPLPETVPDTS